MRTQVLKSTWKVRHHPSVITWMEKYCAEYMNIVGLSSGNDCDSGFVGFLHLFKHAVGCYPSQSYYRARQKTP